MGLIRSGAVIALSSVLFLTLFLGNGLLTLTWSLEYDNVAPHVQNFSGGIFEDLGVRENIINDYQLMEDYCGSYDAYPYNRDEISLKVPCDIIRLGPDSVVNYSVSKFFYDVYNKEYDCSFWKCVKEADNGIFVLISAKANDYWKSKFKLAILASVILAGLLLLVLESKYSLFTITGILMMFSAFPYMKLNWVFGFLPEGSLTGLFVALFTKSYNVFLIMTIIGAVLLAIGIAFEFLGFGLKLSKLFGLFKSKDKVEEKETEDKGKKGDVALGEQSPVVSSKSPVEDREMFTKDEVKEIVRDEIEKIKTEKKIRGKVRKDMKEE
ncbi:MAG: hypothetical protein PF542_04855 [Nanoarchaeota archaeon]|jgi:hypothetical protein|nr:hypothetical protein [Nanoarchaeota archaeon]